MQNLLGNLGIFLVCLVGLVGWVGMGGVVHFELFLRALNVLGVRVFDLMIVYLTRSSIRGIQGRFCMVVQLRHRHRQGIFGFLFQKIGILMNWQDCLGVGFKDFLFSNPILGK